MAQLKLIKNSSGAGKEGTGKAGSRSSKATLDYVYGLAGDRPVAVCSINMIGGTAEAAERAFEATRAAWNKRTKNEVYHWEQSFGKDELDATNPDHWVRANDIGGETARRLWPTRPVEIVTHIGDDGLIHNHYVVGNVDTLTGRAARGQEMAWFRAFPIHEQVLADMGHQQPAIMPKTVDEARARSIEKRENQRDDFAQRWARIWDPNGLTSWSVAEDRAKAEDFEVEVATASRDGRGGVKKGDRILRFRTVVNKRKQVYNGQRYGVDLAEAELRVAQGSQPAPPPPPPIPPVQPAVRPVILLGGVGPFKDQPDTLAMRLAGYTSDEITAAVAAHDAALAAKVTTSPEPSGTESPTEPSRPSTAPEPTVTNTSAQAPDEQREPADRPSVVDVRVPVIDNAWMDELIADELIADELIADELIADELIADELIADEPAIDQDQAHIRPASGPDVTTEEDELEDAIVSGPSAPVTKSPALIAADLWEDEHEGDGDDENDDPQPGS